MTARRTTTITRRSQDGIESQETVPIITILISGEAGAGKTTLASQIAAALDPKQRVATRIYETTEPVHPAKFDAEPFFVGGLARAAAFGQQAGPRTCADHAALNAEAFPVGSVVNLKSGGQPMTVTEDDGDLIFVSWFCSGGGLHEGEFDPRCLEVAQDPPF